MQSAVIIDRPESKVENLVASELLVLWQHPQTREIVPIGRFARRDGFFSFVYTRAVSEVEGFRPLPGLRDLQVVHESASIPAVFNQRVMSSERPDFGVYLASLGLSATATPWEQIVSSGGGRTGDTLQFMAVPSVERGHARARFLASGLSHVADEPLRLPGRTVALSVADHEQLLCELRCGDRLLLEPEDGNGKDPYAILMTFRGLPVAWVPRSLSEGLRPLAEDGECYASVARVGDSGSPYHVRLVLDFDEQVHDGFTFDPSGRWEPLGT